MTRDSLMVQMQYNRKVMKSFPENSPMWKKYFEENIQLGVKLKELKNS